jgi:hypothetical protein
LKRFVPRIRWGIRCLVALATLSGGVSFILTYFGSPESDWLLWVGVSWTCVDVGVLVGTTLFVRAAHRRRGRQLLALVERGLVRRARVLANQVDYGAPAHGPPKIVVALEIDGRSVEVRAFDSDDADLFPPGTVCEVVCIESIPEMVFPISRIPVM